MDTLSISILPLKPICFYQLCKQLPVCPSCQTELENREKEDFPAAIVRNLQRKEARPD